MIGDMLYKVKEGRVMVGGVGDNEDYVFIYLVWEWRNECEVWEFKIFNREINISINECKSFLRVFIRCFI